MRKTKLGPDPGLRFCDHGRGGGKKAVMVAGGEPAQMRGEAVRRARLGGGEDGEKKPLVARGGAGTRKADGETPAPEGGEGPEEAAKGGEGIVRQRPEDRDEFAARQRAAVATARHSP